MKIKSAAFATPELRRIAVLRMAKQIEIAAAHEAKTRSHQPDRAVTDVVRLPGRAGRNACCAEQSPCDVSISFATLVGVERAQDERKTLAPLRADGIRRTVAPSTHGDTPQTSGGSGSCGEICIKGDNDCCRV